jgi:hypothetical protein
METSAQSRIPTTEIHWNHPRAVLAIRAALQMLGVDPREVEETTRRVELFQDSPDMAESQPAEAQAHTDANPHQ